MAREMKVPGPDHPISVEPEPERVVVRAGGGVVADTTRALALHEAGHEAVLYIPREDVADSALSPTPSHTYCPYKGEASYFALRCPDGRLLDDAVWSYEDPYPAVREIAGHLAFYPQHVTFARS